MNRFFGIGLGLAVVGGLLLCFAWFFWLPSWVRVEVARAAQRSGITAEVGSVSLGSRGLTLEVRRASGRGAVLTGSKLTVGGSLLRMWREGRSAVHVVTVSGGTLRVDLADLAASRPDEKARSLRRLRARWPTIEAGEVRVEVRIHRTPLVQVGRAALVVRDRIIVADLRALTLDGGSFHLALDSLRIKGDRDTARVTEIVGAGGEIEVPPETAGLRALIARLGVLSVTAPQGVDKTGEGEPETMRAPRPATGRTSPDPASALSVVRSRLAPAFTASFGALAILYPAERGRETLATGLNATLRRSESGIVETTGAGVNSAGGPFHWDLRRDPVSRAMTGRVGFEALPLAAALPLLPNLPWHAPEQATLSGDLELRAGGTSDAIGVAGILTAENVGFADPRVGPEPVILAPWTLRGEGSWDPRGRALRVDRGTVMWGPLTATLRGNARWSSGNWGVEGQLVLPPVPCQDGVQAIPYGLLGDLRGFVLSGTLSGRVALNIDSRSLSQSELDVRVEQACRFDAVPTLADLRRVERPFLHRVREPDGQWFEMQTGPGTANWTRLEAVSPFAVHAILAHEDASFFHHGGFASWAIRDALIKNLEAGRFAYGASTISMQLAKNLFLHREKNLARKVQEVLLTWWLEEALDKRTILELYLNVIEYGAGVYGVRRASAHYFGRDPSELSPGEGAFLATILPAPKRAESQVSRGTLSPATAGRARQLLAHMHRRGRLDDAAYAFGLTELEAFAFRSREEGPASPRPLAGSAARLPYELAGPGHDFAGRGWDDDAPRDDDGSLDADWSFEWDDAL